MNAKRMTLIDTAAIPGGGELRLFQEGEHYSIKIAGSGDLMATRMHGSEDALAALACRRIAARPAARVLIGGLGMGFTLAAALRHLGPQAQVVVAELVPGVVTWNRDVLGAHAGHPLADARTVVRESDVAQLLRTARAAYDAVMLDVDNGPDGLTHAANGWLYAPGGLAAIHTALRPGGVLTVWSAGPDRQFSERLRRSGFMVEEVTVRAHGNKGARHVVWVALRRATGAARGDARAAASARPLGKAGPTSSKNTRGGDSLPQRNPAGAGGAAHGGAAAPRRKRAGGTGTLCTGDETAGDAAKHSTAAPRGKRTAPRSAKTPGDGMAPPRRR